MKSVPLTLVCTIIQQNGLPICWAAAVASIGLEITGVSKTAEYVSNYMYGENKGGNTYVALLALMEIYGLDGVGLYTAPSFGQIKSEIYEAGHPIYLRVYGGDGASTLNHALFVDGYFDYTSGSYDGCLRVGDPNFTNYKTIYFATDQVYPYTLNGITGYVDEYIYLFSI